MADEKDEKQPSETDDKKPETGKPEKSDDLKAMEAALRKANKEAETFRLKLKEIEDKDKSEVDKLRDELATMTKDRDDLRLDRTRLEVAVSKGLSPAQAKRLVGSTQEELEADADDFLESIKPSGDDKGTPPSNSKESLKGGSDPTEDPEEMDPKKLADMVPRY